MNYAEEIKERLTLADVVETYTGERLHNGKMHCPFHNERTASFTVYKNNTFYCFGCGVSGDVFEFVKRLHNVNFSQAVIRLNNDFALGLPLTGSYDRAEHLKQQKLRKEKRIAEEQARKKADDEYWLWLDRVMYLEKILKIYKPNSPDETPNTMFIVALHWLPYAEYRLSIAYDEKRCLCG